LLQDRDVGVGIFPECEEVLVGNARLRESIAWERGHLARSLLLLAGGRDARAPRNTGFECVGAAQAEMRQRADGLVDDQAGVIENLLKFDGGRAGQSL
jgi:hypothetical protein